jgi:hypothetical protein
LNTAIHQKELVVEIVYIILLLGVIILRYVIEEKANAIVWYQIAQLVATM